MKQCKQISFGSSNRFAKIFRLSASAINKISSLSSKAIARYKYKCYRNFQARLVLMIMIKCWLHATRPLQLQTCQDFIYRGFSPFVVWHQCGLLLCGGTHSQFSVLNQTRIPQQKSEMGNFESNLTDNILKILTRFREHTQS